MNLTLLIGLVGCLGMNAYGILSSGDLGNFIDMSSIYIVLGGTLFGIIGGTPLADIKNIPKHLKIALFGSSRFKPAEIVEQIVECAKIARQSGLLALEEYANNQEDAFFKEALLLIVDAIDADKIRERLTSELDMLDARHSAGKAVYDRGVALGPAMGMLGTLIGLINMLAAMDFDAEGGAQTLAKNMGIALITTFYGSILANILFMPISSQLAAANDKEMLCKQMIIEGILAVQAGENPKFIKEKLLSFLSEKEREQLEDDGN
ncbi:MAG: motility protein A [Anaerovoracaceae bacterium]